MVGMPSGRSPPFGFGIITRRTGSGRYVFETSSSRKPASHTSRPCSSIAQTSSHPHPAHPHWRGRADRRGAGCPRGKSCRRADRSGRRAPPSPCTRAFSEGSGSYQALSRLIANHLHLTIFESAPEVRALCSAGITRPQRSYGPVRLPPCPPPDAMLRPLPSPRRVSPDYPNHPSDVPCPLPRRIARVQRVDCFPTRAAFPKWPEGRHPHCHFRGLLGLHSRYGPPDRSAAQGGLCRGAPTQPVTRPSRPPASRPIDNYLGETLPH